MYCMIYMTYVVYPLPLSHRKILKTKSKKKIAL